MSKVITFRVSDSEFDNIKNRIAFLKEDLDLNITISSFLQAMTNNIANLNFLLENNVISYKDYENAILYHSKVFSL